MQECVLALDLGTTAFKAAAVNEQQVFGRPTAAHYDLDYDANSVTCPPERYLHAALKALRGAAKTARELGLTVRAVGICSQAQTFLAFDKHDEPLAPAIVWTDDRAQSEAEEAALALSNFARTSGFVRPIPLQFLPKVMQFRRQNPNAHRFLLLNEWLISQLTGEAYGDEVNQGMGGFFDIERRVWLSAALNLAGITTENLANIAPAGVPSVLLKPDIARALKLPPVPVYSCGNDQSVAAVGAGLEQAGDILCNFGTAMVVYALRARPVVPAHDAQIAGISPLVSLQGRWFLLGLESECGNVLDWLGSFLYPKRGFPKLQKALTGDFAPDLLPQITRIHGGRMDIAHWSIGSEPVHLARAFWEFYAARFVELLEGVREPDVPHCRLFASGGLSQCQEWLEFLSKRVGLPFVRTPTTNPSLVGIARIISMT